jgi:periplasmic divalent cation tolerance protein
MADENAMTLVRTTFDSEDAARALARRLIEKQWACCVHLWRIDSVYLWDEKVHEAGEWMVEARVPSHMAEDTWARIVKTHPYDVPLVEIAAETRVNGKYAQWARDVMGLA